MWTCNGHYAGEGEGCALRRAFNQVRILDRYNFGSNGEFVGLDVKAMRTQKDDSATKHLLNSREVFLALLELSRLLDQKQIDGFVQERDYDGLDLLVIKHLMGKVQKKYLTVLIN